MQFRGVHGTPPATSAGGSEPSGLRSETPKLTPWGPFRGLPNPSETHFRTPGRQFWTPPGPPFRLAGPP